MHIWKERVGANFLNCSVLTLGENWHYHLLLQACAWRTVSVCKLISCYALCFPSSLRPPPIHPHPLPRKTNIEGSKILLFQAPCLCLSLLFPLTKFALLFLFSSRWNSPLGTFKNFTYRPPPVKLSSWEGSGTGYHVVFLISRCIPPPTLAVLEWGESSNTDFDPPDIALFSSSWMLGFWITGHPNPGRHGELCFRFLYVHGAVSGSSEQCCRRKLQQWSFRWGSNGESREGGPVLCHQRLCGQLVEWLRSLPWSLWMDSYSGASVFLSSNSKKLWTYLK